MKIIYVQTYPLYHDIVSTQDWLRISNRDKWMPALTKASGHDVELWGVGNEDAKHIWNESGFPELTVREFAVYSRFRKSRHHYSKSLCEAAKTSSADLFILKGSDGGAGIYLAKKILIPKKIPFDVVIGGTVWHPLLQHARNVYFETEHQKETLLAHRRFFRKIMQPEQLIRLPKSVDTELFHPQKTVKEFDIIAMGRLIPNYKNYDALISLSKECSVAVIGGGPMLEKFRSHHPDITWLGHIPHQEIPSFLNKGRLFFHTGFRDFFPRVIPEAAACGLPVLAFSSAIAQDVISPEIGLRLSDSDWISEITALLADQNRQKELGKNARKYAVNYWGKTSTLSVVNQTICRK